MCATFAIVFPGIGKLANVIFYVSVAAGPRFGNGANLDSCRSWQEALDPGQIPGWRSGRDRNIEDDIGNLLIPVQTIANVARVCYICYGFPRNWQIGQWHLLPI